MRLIALVALALLALRRRRRTRSIPGHERMDRVPAAEARRARGIFKKNGVDIEIRFIAPVQRSAALASGALNAAATTVDQHIVWASAGHSVGAGGAHRQVEGRRRASRCATTSTRSRISRASRSTSTGPGTVQHFMLSYILEKNGMSIQDVIRSTMAAQPAAQAFVAGQGDAALTYEPYLSSVREKPDAGRSSSPRSSTRWSSTCWCSARTSSRSTRRW
jgi:NitT/TauT family transport system substrate-binding protein